MTKKNTIIIIAASALVSGVMIYLVINNIKRKKEADILSKRLEQLTTEYPVFN